MQPKKTLAERYKALTPAQQRVAGAHYIECAEQQAKRTRVLCWDEAITAAEELMRV
jgi:hypothetical protein